jgi:predicted DCC family thiol-disulfide oxidoreductase YuxK
LNSTGEPLRPVPTRPILLYNDECGVCRRIGHWVQKSARSKSGDTSLIVQPIGDDPAAIRALDPDLDIWDAYATIHLLMPDGSTKLGGEAVAEVLRRLPGTQWFSWSFSLSVLGFRPFQKILDLAYAVLADIRPLFGCESCGPSRFWGAPMRWVHKWTKSRFIRRSHRGRAPHFSPLAAAKLRTLPRAEGPPSVR